MVQWSVHDVHHTFQSRPQVKFKWSYTSATPIRLHSVYIKILLMTVSRGINVDLEVLCKHAENIAKNPVGQIGLFGCHMEHYHSAEC